MIKNLDFDIFISYHGDSNATSSSYQVASSLKDYLENHSGRKYKCFLCKRENANDFYDAINSALLSAKHFILVACQKEGLSNWVSDELKQFDGLRKIGKKPNSIINAFIYGEMTIDDLIEFNSLFSTKDIAFGDSGFEKLYNMVDEIENHNDKTLSFNLKKENFSNIVYLCPLKSEIEQKIKIYLADEISNNIIRKINDDILVFESYVVKTIITKYIDSSELLILKVQNPNFIADYLSSIAITKELTVLLVNYDYDIAVFMCKGDIIPVPSINDFEMILGDEKLEVSAKKVFDKNQLSLIFQEKEIELSFDSGDAYDNIFYYKINIFADNAWSILSTELTSLRFYIYVLNALYNHAIPKGTDLSEEILNEIEFCSMDISNEEIDLLQIEHILIKQKNESLIRNEYLLWDYYQCIKSGNVFDEDGIKKLFSSKYGEIAYKLKEYYSKHSIDLILYVMEKLYKESLEERKNGFYSRYEFINRMLFEFSIHNIFILDNQCLASMNLYENILNIFKEEYITSNKYTLKSLICAYKKELVFSGKLDADTYTLKVNELLKEFDDCILDILNTAVTLDKNDFKKELLLLYRQRSVVWEQCGDRSIQQAERLKYYNLWKLDCEQAIEVSKLFDCDKEILGCVYLNLASSLNRLYAIEKDKSTASLDKCLIYLDTAVDLLKICSAERYVGYAYLHKSDCYDAKLNLKISNGWDYNFESIVDIVKEIRRNASYAMNIFKNTDDNVAKSSAMRLTIKGKILSSNDATLLSNIKNGLKLLRDALKCCKSSRHVNGMAACVNDFTFYNQIIEKKNLYDSLLPDITCTFFEEMAVFSSIIKLLDLDKSDIMKMQEQVEQLVSKLID